MTERELKNNILIAIYHREGKLNIDTVKFCKEEGIECKNDEQHKRIFKSLKDDGYINAIFMENGNGHILSITSQGVEYAENILAKKFNETTLLEKKDSLQSGMDENTQESVDKQAIYWNSTSVNTNISEAREYFPIIKDQSIEPCFGVENLAKCFVKQLDSISNADANNVCMVGIFAPWGRGKSYFFNKVKTVISKRNELKKTTDINYTIVEFNAWKHQETPAIWAYLFETLYNHKNCRFRFWYTVKQNWKLMFGDILLFFLPLVVVLLSGQDCSWIKGALGLGLIGIVVNFLLKHYNSAISFIKKYSKGVSFFNEMGIQAEIEKELSSLLKFWVKENETTRKKILLYVDDIDRCSETKMVSIIDSLRTVLENEEIKKRLIVICSVDPEKIKLGIEYKYKELFKDNKLKEIAIEQMDKIFLTGLSLPPLDIDQQIEFLTNLAEINSSQAKENHNASTQTPPYSINKTKNSLYAIDEAEGIIEKIDNKKIFDLLSGFIKDYKKELTPRKIRVIYYRMLLANNIISNDVDGILFPHRIAKAIFDLSCKYKCEMTADDAFYDVVKMVVIE